jgi:sulfur-oxidizing protein SoxY
MKNPLRRRLLAAALSSPVLLHLRGVRAQQRIDVLQPLVQSITGGAQVHPGRVHVELPRLADNGNAVPLKVTVDCPMTEREFVRTIHVLSGKNPRPLVAVFHLNPQCGRAEVSTRVRLNGTQQVLVLAGLSDGSFWSGTADVDVTALACLDATD